MKYNLQKYVGTLPLPVPGQKILRIDESAKSEDSSQPDEQGRRKRSETGKSGEERKPEQGNIRVGMTSNFTGLTRGQSIDRKHGLFRP